MNDVEIVLIFSLRWSTLLKYCYKEYIYKHFYTPSFVQPLCETGKEVLLLLINFIKKVLLGPIPASVLSTPPYVLSQIKNKTFKGLTECSKYSMECLENSSCI